MTDIPEIITDGALIQSDIHSLPGESTYAGVTSFLRRPYRKDLTNIDAAVIGIPFDTATTNRPGCLLYTSPSPRDKRQSRMPSSA